MLTLDVSTASAGLSSPDLIGEVIHTTQQTPSLSQAHVPLTPLLCEGNAIYEDWRLTTTSALLRGQHLNCHFAHDENWLFAHCHVSQHATLAEATSEAYEALFATLAKCGFTHLVRCWNYVPQINEHDAAQNLERYRIFNIARQNVFGTSPHPAAEGAPAASALGSHQGQFTLYALATRHAPISIENPRQVSAYHYPQQYGPKSPNFSRATLVPSATAVTLFISGTASIVGHASQHEGDLIAQTQETLRNISTLVEQANLQLQQRQFTQRLSLQDLSYKVFIRHADDASAVQALLIATIGADTECCFLHADVCRSELLVEIEASATLPRAS